METFIQKHADNILGSLSCVDRIVFKGYLPVSWADSFTSFLSRNGCLIKDFKAFVSEKSAWVKPAAQETAEANGRPYIYLNNHLRKEAYVKEIIKRDGLAEGLVCVLAALESCQSFRVQQGKGRPVLKNARRKCLCLYFYFLDPVYGLLHIRIQTWMPLNIQICMNGHEWLARRLQAEGIGFAKQDNCFTHIEDMERAQQISDEFHSLDWRGILDELAARANPLLGTLFKGMSYYWVCDQMEYATDIVFTKPFDDLYDKLLNHSIVRLGAKDILSFLGKPFDGRFKGEQINGCKKRFPGARVRHWMKRNWIKMYTKNSAVLRIETVINHPYDFRIRRSGIRKGEPVIGWFPMSKCVANLYRYVEVCVRANERYLDALSSVDDPAPSRKELSELSTPVERKQKRFSGFNPVQPCTSALFRNVLSGEYIVQGFRNADIREALFGVHRDPWEKRRVSARVSRLLKKLHVRGLIAKIPRSRRWRVTQKGWRVLGPLVEAYA